MTYAATDTYVYEWSKIVWEIVRYTRGRGLDVGCGTQKAYGHMIGVDNRYDADIWKDVKGGPEIVTDAADLSMFSDGCMNFVFSSFLLQYLEKPEKALAEWWRVIKVGGYLVLYLPHKDFAPHKGTKGAPSGQRHDFLPANITDFMRNVGSWDLVKNEPRSEDEEYSFFQVFQKLPKGAGVKHSYLAPKPGGKTAGVVRYGAWGDALQTSSVIQALKNEGYRVTFYGTERSYEVLKSDPNISDVVLQDSDQVPNAFLDQFFAHEAKKYDKFVNLCESVESQWLAVPNKDNWHKRPHSVRVKYADGNYIEYMHDVAEVPYTKPLIKFHPHLAEREGAAKFKEKLGGSPLIVWALAGSSVHKIYPWIDNALAWLMIHLPKCKVVMVGDAKCKMIEDNIPDGTPGSQLEWGRVPCVVKTSGVLSIRDTLALAQIADLVIGPETGVLSGMSMEKMPKICFLSHSSHQNLTRDWLNTFALFPTQTPCYPCHQLHYDWKHCKESPIKGIAQCQYDIPASAVITAMEKIFGINTQKVIPLHPEKKEIILAR